MKRFFLLFAILFLSSSSWSQKSTGILIVSPSANFSFKLPDRVESSVLTYTAMGGIGWYRQKWHKEKLFRAFDIRFSFATGDFSAARYREIYDDPKIPDGEYKAWGMSFNWKLGTPLFHTEFDDRILWYATAGVGFDYGFYEAVVAYNSNNGPSERNVDEELFQPKFLDLGIGFETRMGKNWYLNTSANLGFSYHVGANISLRFLRRKSNNMVMYR